MNQHLKLKEIIYEITGKCKNNCSYCGSKECWNEGIDERRILSIAKEIASYPPEEIDISGGDPLQVEFTVHERIVKILHDAGVRCKILFNPKSLRILSERNHTEEEYGYAENKVEILKLYDWIGISINTKEELEIYSKMSSLSRTKIDSKLTVISNFNVSNVFLFSEIAEFVKATNIGWQIQYTMYSDDSDLAIYKNDEARKFLFESIDKAQLDGVKIIVADNMNCGTCSAGKNSLGILSDGTIVPCLSMRSWIKDIKSVSQGNIAKGQSLELIWNDRFKEQRFADFKCCKDWVGNKPYTRTGIEKNTKATKSGYERYPEKKNSQILYGVWPVEEKNKPIKTSPVYVYGVAPFEPQVVMYAVRPSETIVYAVSEPPSVDLYAVAEYKTYTNATEESYEGTGRMVYGVVPLDEIPEPPSPPEPPKPRKVIEGVKNSWLNRIVYGVDKLPDRQ